VEYRTLSKRYLDKNFALRTEGAPAMATRSSGKKSIGEGKTPAKKPRPKSSGDYPFKPLICGYDRTNARAMVDFSNIAYKPEPTILRELSRRGFSSQNVRCFDQEGTQAFAAVSDKALIVAFRGTEIDLNDIYADINAKWQEGLYGKVHKGFYDALECVWRDISGFLDDHSVDSLPVWFTGHSLGGALAVLAAAKQIKRKGTVSGVYTFGGPRCGNTTFANTFNARFSHACRFVYEEDIVTRIPPRSLFGRSQYRHVGDLFHIKGGRVYKKGRVEDPFPFISTLESLCDRDFSMVEDHRLANYLNVL
jgi:triacylglycerol lipase